MGNSNVMQRPTARISDKLVANVWAVRRAKGEGEDNDAEKAVQNSCSKPTMASVISDAWAGRRGGRT